MGAEQWRDAPGFEGFYQVSNLGRVRALPRYTCTFGGAKRFHGGGVMAPALDKDGYPRVIFRIDGKHYTRAVHRLVCEAFNGPPNALHREVHHNDQNRANACADNLRWVSRGENIELRRSAGEANGFARLTAVDVRRIRERRDLTAKCIAAEYGVSPYTIWDIRRGRRWGSLA